MVKFTICLNKENIESEICQLIRSHSIKSIPGWDGFVGNIPEKFKKSMSRDSKIDDLLG